MELRDLDVAIARLAAALERVGTNLVEIENDERCRLLEAASLRGRTAEQWQNARTKLAGLFDGYVRMTALLERVNELRLIAVGNATRSAELEHALFGASLQMSATPVAFSERGLLDGSTKVVYGTPNELIAEMTRSFEFVKTVMLEVGGAWDQLVPRVAAARDQLGRVRTRARDLGDEWADQLAHLVTGLDEIAEAAAADPLSTKAGDIEGLERSIDSLSREIERAARLCAELEDRIAAARHLVDSLGAEQQTCRALQRETAAKIVAAAPESPRASNPRFDRDLDRIVILARGGEWRAASCELEAWKVRIGDARSRVDELAAAFRDSLARRDELRGRLDAYHAKAAGLGFVEDGGLARLFDAAHDELFTAPTDLARADTLVRRYQDAVTTNVTRKAAM
jgi:hypothetical protein